MRSRTTGACPSEAWLLHDVRVLLGAFGRSVQVFNVYSAGDSGEGCEVIEFTTLSSCGPIPWTARIYVKDGARFTECTVGW